MKKICSTAKHTAWCWRPLLVAALCITAACSMPAREPAPPAADAGVLEGDAATPEYPDGGPVDPTLPTCEETSADARLYGYVWPDDCAVQTSCPTRGCTGCLVWAGASSLSNLAGTCE